jgi:hypothetical protein
MVSISESGTAWLKSKALVYANTTARTGDRPWAPAQNRVEASFFFFCGAPVRRRAFRPHATRRLLKARLSDFLSFVHKTVTSLLYSLYG